MLRALESLGKRPRFFLRRNKHPGFRALLPRVGVGGGSITASSRKMLRRKEMGHHRRHPGAERGSALRLCSHVGLGSDMQATEADFGWFRKKNPFLKDIELLWNCPKAGE